MVFGGLSQFTAQCAMSLEEPLIAVEQLLEKVSAALLAADALSLEKHSAALRDATVMFSQTLQQQSAQGEPIPAPMQKRIAAVSKLLVVYRENLARLSAVTDRQAAGLLPPSDSASTTYGDGRGGRVAQPGVPRIYRSAG